MIQQMFEVSSQNLTLLECLHTNFCSARIFWIECSFFPQLPKRKRAGVPHKCGQAHMLAALVFTVCYPSFKGVSYIHGYKKIWSLISREGSDCLIAIELSFL